MTHSPGKELRAALREERPLQIVGTINAYTAIMAKQVGYKAIYLSGAGVANASYGLPDLGMTSLSDVLNDVSRITSACDLPLLVDADTGWGHILNIDHTVKEMIKAGAAGIHIEDQPYIKRCGHRPGKTIIAQEEMSDRIKAAVDARTDENFVIMARTDALANEGLEAAIERAKHYVKAGADMIFPEAITELSMYSDFANALNVPILANITEFGKTPLFTVSELAKHHVSLILYPLTAFRTMSKAALMTYQTLRKEGTQKNIVESMQTREELYATLNYYEHEDRLNQLLNNEQGK